MKPAVRKFLEFNGKTIYFLAKDGAYWVAIKPICEALKINYDRQFKNLKSDKIFGQLYAKQHMVGADSRLRSMISLPEKWIYGWIYRINSDSPELLAYQVECCEVLHDYFHGSITSRETLIASKTKAEIEYENLLSDFLNTPSGRRAAELEKEIKMCRSGLRNLDKEIEKNQLPLFKSG